MVSFLALFSALFGAGANAHIFISVIIRHWKAVAPVHSVVKEFFSQNVANLELMDQFSDFVLAASKMQVLANVIYIYI
jgi:hypothetical protein